jgi:hypothetical protein
MDGAMGQLKQLNLKYQPGEDRACLRISTGEQAEYRFWLTRRFVRILWPVLIQLLEADDRVQSQPRTDARQTVLSFQHEQALQGADFVTGYQEDAATFPLGSEPVLLTSIRAKRNEGGTPVLGLSGEGDRGVELALSDQLLHSLCKLLADTAEKAEWKLGLMVVPDAPKVAQSAQRLN